MRVLVIEDQPQIADALQRGLSEHDFSVTVAESASQGQKEAAGNEYDIILLDVMLPDGDGTELCRQFRDQGIDARILMLTALDSTQDKVTGLDSGADDYLTKPFEFSELLARIRALSRRDGLADSRRLRFEDLELDLYSRVATRGGRSMQLSNKEFALLECLMRNADREVSRDEISEQAWHKPADNTSNLVDVYVSSLRKKIDAGHEHSLIHTVKGVGYRLGAN